MTDQSQTGDDGEENEQEEFELEGFMSREEGATVLRRLADGVESGSVELGGDDGTVTVPDQFEIEFEYEEEADEAELEVELEWSTDDGEPESTESDADEDESVGADDEE